MSDNGKHTQEIYSQAKSTTRSVKSVSIAVWKDLEADKYTDTDRQTDTHRHTHKVETDTETAIQT